MEIRLYKFDITDFEEVYAIFDKENKRLHISPVNYDMNLTLDLSKDLNTQIEQEKTYRELNFFEQRLRPIVEKIVKEVVFYG